MAAQSQSLLRALSSSLPPLRNLGLRTPSVKYNALRQTALDIEGLHKMEEPQRRTRQLRFLLKKLCAPAAVLLIVILVIAEARYHLRSRLLASSLYSPTRQQEDAADNKSLPLVKIHYKSQNVKIDSGECTTPVALVSDESEAHIVVWPNPSHNLSEYDGELARKEKPWQLHGFWSLENVEYYPAVQEARQKMAAGDVKAFDFEATYKTTSDFPIPYAYWYMNFRKPALPFEARRPDKIAAAFISNCSPANNRTVILEELMKLLPGQIDSFGSCLKNADADEEVKKIRESDQGLNQPQELSSWDQKMRIIQRYKFTISFENANEEDYVTEKYYQALEAGSIPIHLGLTTEQFEKFKPSSDSALNVADFNTFQELATRMKLIAEDRDRFERMLQWKKKPFAPGFAEIVEWGKTHEACRMALFARKMWTNPHASQPEKYPSLYRRLDLLTSHNKTSAMAFND